MIYIDVNYYANTATATLMCSIICISGGGDGCDGGRVAEAVTCGEAFRVGTAVQPRPSSIDQRL